MSGARRAEDLRSSLLVEDHPLVTKAVEERERRGLSGLQKGLIVLLVLALLGSVAGRWYFARGQSSGSGTPGVGNSLVEGGTAPEEPPSGAERALPYVTEGSLFGLIGFALGYASRKFVKIGLIVLALFFVGLQALVWTGSVSVDWGGLAGKLNALVFNLKENESVLQFITRRIPSGASLLAGYALGFQRG